MTINYACELCDKDYGTTDPGEFCADCGGQVTYDDIDTAAAPSFVVVRVGAGKVTHVAGRSGLESGYAACGTNSRVRATGGRRAINELALVPSMDTVTCSKCREILADCGLLVDDIEHGAMARQHEAEEEAAAELAEHTGAERQEPKPTPASSAVEAIIDAAIKALPFAVATDERDELATERAYYEAHHAVLEPCECHGMEALCEECGGRGWRPFEATTRQLETYREDVDLHAIGIEAATERAREAFDVLRRAVRLHVKIGNKADAIEAAIANANAKLDERS